MSFKIKNTKPIHSYYRADIDGLRAVAVLLVVVFHVFPELNGGGFIGVDIFFVISGFLITGIIVSDLELRQFSFKTFYARRIKRIYPALLLVLLTSYVAGWILFLPDEFASLSKHIAGGAGFIANVVLWTESGYFDVQTELKPLLHLWSLGVEEQFYVMWPLLVFLAYYKHAKFFGLLPLVFIGSWLCNIKGMHNDPVGAFYLPHSRFWELMTGAAVAYMPRFFTTRYSLANAVARIVSMQRIQNMSAGLGLVLLITAVVVINKKAQFPGWWAVLPTLGAVLIISAGPYAWINKKVLAHPLLVFFGLISYPLYLWHWPLLVFARIMSMGTLSFDVRAELILLSIMLSWLTYRFVEQPLRFGHTRYNKTLRLSLLMVFVFSIGYSTFKADGLSFRMPDKAEYDNFFSHLNYTNSHNLLKYDRHECNFYDIVHNVSKPTIATDCITPHSKTILFLWGDSHAQHLNYGLRAILPEAISLLQAGASGCPPSATDLSPDPLQTCNRSNRFVWHTLATLIPKIVILAQQRGHDVTQLNAVIAKLKTLGVTTVVLVGPVPHWNPFLYKIILKTYWSHTEQRLNKYLDQKILNSDVELKKQYSHLDNIRYVSLIDGLCNQQGCLTYLNNDRKEGLITYDYGHFTLPASKYVASTILLPVLNQTLAD